MKAIERSNDVRNPLSRIRQGDEDGDDVWAEHDATFQAIYVADDASLGIETAIMTFV